MGYMKWTKEANFLAHSFHVYIVTSLASILLLFILFLLHFPQIPSTSTVLSWKEYCTPTSQRNQIPQIGKFHHHIFKNTSTPSPFYVPIVTRKVLLDLLKLQRCNDFPLTACITLCCNLWLNYSSQGKGLCLPHLLFYPQNLMLCFWLVHQNLWGRDLWGRSLI